MREFSSRAGISALTLMVTLVAGACGEDDSTGPEVYSEPNSVQIWSLTSEIEIATGTETLTNATIFVPAGNSEAVEFVFFDQDSNPITPRSGEFLEVQINDQTIGTFTPDQTGAFTGTLRGLAPGTTGLVVRYMYGGVNNSNAEASFVSASFDFTVF